jgi:hypothetical protein
VIETVCGCALDRSGVVSAQSAAIIAIKFRTFIFLREFFIFLYSWNFIAVRPAPICAGR